MPRTKIDPPFPSREEIEEFLRNAEGDVSRREIARAFNVKGEHRAKLNALIRSMMADGEIRGNGAKKVTAADALPPVLAIDLMSVDENGDHLCLPSAWEGETEPPIIKLSMREASRQKPALGVGDRVLARLSPAGDDGYDARIIRPLGRGAHRFLAVFRKTRTGGVAEPVERRAKNTFMIAANDSADAKEGDLVWVEAQPSGRGRGGYSGKARVKGFAGHVDDRNAFSLIALASHDIRIEMPRDVIAEAEAVRAATLDGRTDLRNIGLLTIDPEDAKDHDDAVFAAVDEDPANKGGYIVIVAIADVSWFVRPDTRLDNEAQRRGNSVYLPDRVVPMLPERLSNDLCSLKENVDRPCIAVRMTIGADGRKRNQKFMRAMMRSAAKLSYGEAQAMIADPKAAGPTADSVKLLYAAFQARWRERGKRAPLDLDLPERKIILNAHGEVERIVKRERFDAHRLIEEFMILANVAAAETLEQAKVSQIYRVHDVPDPEKLNSVRDYLEDLDYSLDKGAVRPSQFNQILKIAFDRGQQEMISDVILRSQRQAVYATENLGHFGLNLARYSHFTSPIRRYADLTVHRALVTACRLGEGGQTTEEARRLSKTADEISNLERRAIAVEREATDRYLASFLEGKVGEEFDGRIRGVTRFGLFVVLDETGADGFTPLRALGDDRYEHIEENHALIGVRHGGVYHLGQPVRVRVTEAAPLRGGLTFEMVSDPVEKPAHLSLPSRRQKQTGRGQRPGSKLKRGRTNKSGAKKKQRR